MSELNEKVKTNPGEFTPEEQEAYDRLVDPDEGRSSPGLNWCDEYEQLLIGALVLDETFLRQHHGLINPKQFTRKCHQSVAKVVLGHFARFQSAPSVAIVKQEVKRDAGEDVIGFLAEIDTFLFKASNTPNNTAFVGAKIDDFLCQQNFQQVIGQAFAKIKKGESVRAIIECAADGLRMPRASHPAPTMNSWDQDSLAAANQREDWVVENWLEFGTLGLFTGLPFAGKSTIVAQLLASIAKGTGFYAMSAAQVPFVLLDFENRERALIGRIKNCMDGDEGRIRELYHRVHPNQIPRPLTTDFIAGLIQQLSAQMTAPKGLVVIDTFRSAFVENEDFDELDVKSMVRLLKSLKDLAVETGWAILVLHHNAKASNEYSGSTAIAAVADYMWNWKVKKEEKTGVLSCEGRADYQEPLKLAYDCIAKRNVLLGPLATVTADQKKHEEDKVMARLLDCLPDNGDQAVSVMAIQEKIVCSSKTAESLVKKAVEKQLIHRLGEGRKGKPYRYHLAEQGKNRRFANSVTQ